MYRYVYVQFCLCSALFEEKRKDTLSLIVSIMTALSFRFEMCNCAGAILSDFWRWRMILESHTLIAYIVVKKYFYGNQSMKCVTKTQIIQFTIKGDRKQPSIKTVSTTQYKVLRKNFVFILRLLLSDCEYDWLCQYAPSFFLLFLLLKTTVMISKTSSDKKKIHTNFPTKFNCFRQVH